MAQETPGVGQAFGSPLGGGAEALPGKASGRRLVLPSAQPSRRSAGFALMAGALLSALSVGVALGFALRAGSSVPESRAIGCVIPTSPGGLAEARCAYNEGRYRAALGLVEGSLLQGPERSEVLHLRGDILCQLGRMREAVADYGSALEAEPLSPSIHISRAEAMIYLNQPEAAIRDLERSLELEPEGARSRERRGWLHQLHDNPQALR